MDGLKELLDKFLELVLKLPRAVQIIAAFFLMGVIGYVVWILFPPPPPRPPEKSPYDVAYQDAMTLNPSDKPWVIKKKIENLMHLAVTDQQRCYACGVYLSVAEKHPDAMAPSLYAFLYSSSSAPPPCAVPLIAQAQRARTTQVAAAAVSRTPSPVSLGSPAPRLAGPETAASQFLQATTRVGTTGWMYLGVAAPDGNHLTAERTILQPAIPRVAGDRIVTAATVNIRQMPSPLETLGPIIGVASKGSTVTLTGPPVPKRNGSGRAARTLVWAPVSLTEKVRPPEIAQAAASPTGAPTKAASTPVPAATVAPVTSRIGSESTPGIDVSAYNVDIDWPSVARGGVRFVFIKATQGSSFFDDSSFPAQWAASKRVGLVRGAYHFLTLADGAEQARNFLSHVKLEAGDLPPVLDIEVRGGDPREHAKNAVAFLAAVDAALHRKAIIYAGYTDLAALLEAAPALAKYPVWIASYGVAVPEVPGTGTKWTFWQYSYRGAVSGISGSVDLDRFNGSLDELRAFAAGR